MPRLFIYPKKQDPFTFLLKNQKVSIGRAGDNDISIPDPFISGKHAMIYPIKDGHAIRDNNSKNKTFINGNKIQAEVKLNKGDEILMGSTRIIFDKELSTNVELTDAELSADSVNTIMNLEDVLKKPDISSTIRAAVPFDLDRIKDEHQALSIINEVSKALVIHMPLNELLDHIMDLISDVLPMDRGILMLREGHPVQFIPKVVRINNKKLVNLRFQVAQSIINMSVDNHSSILTSDAQADPRFKARESVIKLNIHSAMCVPLWNNKEIIGIIYVDRISNLDQFTQEDLKLLTLLSNLAAVKIENAKLTEQAIEKEKMERELALAAQIQKDFLPNRIPESRAFDIVGDNIPCHQVGGDYYDFLEIDENRLLIVIADVSGKGVSASLLMASLRAALHSEIHPEHDIEAMASKLNDFVHRSSAANSFITFFYAELNKKTGEMKYINAGHNPPLHIDTKNNITRFESSGLPLGMFTGQKYKPRSVSLNPGEMVILFTDGITESRNEDNQEFSEDRLIASIKNHRKASSQEILSKIQKEVEEYTRGMEPMDDMTLVIIKRKS